MRQRARVSMGTTLLGVGLTLLTSLTGCGGGGLSSEAAPVTFTQASAPATRVVTVNGQQVEADEVLVTMKDSGSAATDQQNVTALVNKYHLGRTVYEILDLRTYTLTTSDTQDLPSLVQSLKSEPTVQSAELNGVGTVANQAGTGALSRRPSG